MSYMSGEVMVMAVRLTAMFHTLRSNMNLTTGVNITREVEVEVIHLHYSLPHDHQHIPKPEMMGVMWRMEVQPSYFQMLCSAPWMCLQNGTAKQSALEQGITQLLLHCSQFPIRECTPYQPSLR
jgi:hypothetical protein